MRRWPRQSGIDRVMWLGTRQAGYFVEERASHLATGASDSRNARQGSLETPRRNDKPSRAPRVRRAKCGRWLVQGAASHAMTAGTTRMAVPPGRESRWCIDEPREGTEQ